MKRFTRILMFIAFKAHAAGDPQISSWFTVDSSQFAQIYRTDAAKFSGAAATTWSNGRNVQSQPAYCGVQEILSSANWIYIRSTGLGSQIMGPWQNGRFPNLPTDQHFILAIPRHPTVQATLRFNPLGEIGMFVDGVRMFDANDAFSYSNQNGRDADPRAGIGQGDRIWNRDAFVNESRTFDASMGHQQNWGRYHYHAEPIALRYLLGDHVDFDAATKTYRESRAAPVKHSPILGWMHDGYPIYGPFGYANPTNPASGVRRMVSGFTLRNGENGADNLAQTGRTTLPAWETRLREQSKARADQEELGSVRVPRADSGVTPESSSNPFVSGGRALGATPNATRGTRVLPDMPPDQETRLREQSRTRAAQEELGSVRVPRADSGVAPESSSNPFESDGRASGATPNATRGTRVLPDMPPDQETRLREQSRTRAEQEELGSVRVPRADSGVAPESSSNPFVSGGQASGATPNATRGTRVVPDMPPDRETRLREQSKTRAEQGKLGSVRVPRADSGVAPESSSNPFESDGRASGATPNATRGTRVLPDMPPDQETRLREQSRTRAAQEELGSVRVPRADSGVAPESSSNPFVSGGRALGATPDATRGTRVLPDMPPAWEARENARVTVLQPSETGPNVSPYYPLGHYLEDYAYLGDCGKVLGRDFDLDELNGRWCVTPEFPNGTYAYFTTIDAAGQPVYPYNMGRRYHGNPVGRLIRAIGEPVTTNFVNQANASLTAAVAPAGPTTLIWNNGNGGYESK